MPRWSPDGRRIAFVRSIEKDGKPQPGQIYVLDMNGGEAYPLTQDTKGVTSIEWSPDGKTVAFTAPVGGEEQDKRDGKEQEAKSDVQVITRAVYRANGNPTYVDAGRHTHIFTVAVTNGGDKPQTKQVTDGEYDEREIEWAPDGSKIYFISTRVPEAYYEASDSDLYSVPATGGTITKVASIEGTINAPRVSPDGHRIAFVGTPHGNPVRSYSQPDLFVVDAAPGSAPRNLTEAYDFDIAGGIGGDQAPPRGQSGTSIVWSKDGASLIVVSAEHGSANLKRLTIATGKVDALTNGLHAIGAFTARRRTRSTIAATISTQTNIGDLFMIDAKPSPDHAREPGVVQGHSAERARGDLVQELRRQEHSGLDSQAAGLRFRQEVSADPGDPRRTARGVRQRVHARVPVDGREGLRRAFHESARQHARTARTSATSSSTTTRVTTIKI